MCLSTGSAFEHTLYVFCILIAVLRDNATCTVLCTV